MATIGFNAERAGERLDVRTVLWPGLAAGDDGAWVELPAFPDATVHVYGTFGGTTVTIQGSNEPTAPANPVTLRGVAGAVPLTFTAVGLQQILEGVRWVRPLVTGGTGVAVSVAMVLR